MLSVLGRYAATAHAWLDIRSRWQQSLVAASAGALSVLAFAPFFLWPILWLTLPVWIWLAEISERQSVSTRRRMFWRKTAAGRAAETGWWWGFGFFVVGLSWIGEAFLVEADVFAWLLPFAITLLPAGLACFTAVAMAAATAIAQPGPRRILALAAALGATEWLRGNILSGFPWNVIGYALTYPLPMMQFSSIFGIYGLTIIAVIAFAAPAVMLQQANNQSDPDLIRSRRRTAILTALLPLLMLATGAVWRLVVIDQYDMNAQSVAGPRVRIVQPSVLQREKWRPENQRRIFDDHIALSQQRPDGALDGAIGIALIVWPEAAMPFRPLDTPAALAEIGRFLPTGSTLISGALRVEEASSGNGQQRRVFNSLLAFGESGKLVASYDKTHLVPFGEYLPLQALMESIGLQQLSKLRGGFAQGVRPRALMTIPSVGDFGTLVCYEAIFPQMNFAPGVRPRAIVNVTNDGWFGNSIGPRQHFHQARVRAVEQGVPLIRAANNGISAVIDPFGRVPGQLDLNIRGSLDVILPATAAMPLYGRWGDFVFLVMLMTLLAWVLRRESSKRA